MLPTRPVVLCTNTRNISLNTLNTLPNANTRHNANTLTTTNNTNTTTTTNTLHHCHFPID
jgi:hypothetical protein